MMHTLNDILENKSVKRLKGILSSRYGTGLEIKFLNDLVSVEGDSQSSLYIEGALHIPIFSGDKFIAKVSLPDAYSIGYDQHDNVSDLVKMVMEPIMENWIAQQSEPRLQSTLQPIASHDNVIPLFVTKNRTEIKTFQTAVIYLESELRSEVVKVASQLHEMSGRWASVPYEAVADSIKTVEDISQLGSMTVNINEILNVAPKVRELLAAYLKSAPSIDEPLFIISSSSPMQSLVDQSILSKEFVRTIQNCIIEVDRLPKNNDLRLESLELFLEPRPIL